MAGGEYLFQVSNREGLGTRIKGEGGDRGLESRWLSGKFETSIGHGTLAGQGLLQELLLLVDRLGGGNNPLLHGLGVLTGELPLKDPGELLLELGLGAHGVVDEGLEPLEKGLVLGEIEPELFHPVLERVDDPQTAGQGLGLVLLLKRVPGPGDQVEQLLWSHKGAVGEQEGLHVLKICTERKEERRKTEEDGEK